MWGGPQGLPVPVVFKPVPYDPIEAKPLCQKKISGVSVYRCMGLCFNYMLQTLAPHWAHCCSHEKRMKTPPWQESQPEQKQKTDALMQS